VAALHGFKTLVPSRENSKNMAAPITASAASSHSDTRPAQARP